jgi:hypothetical protein
MISRHWIGIVKRDKVDDYIVHLDTVVMPNLTKTHGVRNCYYLKREVRQGMEFLVVTEWDTVDDIIAFAGPHYENAVIDPIAREMMVSYDKKVRHYHI